MHATDLRAPEALVERPGMELESDVALLAAVSQRRDRQAFAEFVARHQHAAFNLALYLTRRHESAEDVVQEALLRAWKGAVAYREEGTPRSWFLRIVAREGLRRAKDKQKERKQMSLEETKATPDQGRNPAQAAEREEQLAALRRGLTQLPSVHRQVVALYYVAGMEQAEIGAELAISQQAVSLRIQEALGQLRELLGRAGFTSALPLLTAEGIEAAFHSSGHAPAGFLEQALERIAGLREAAQSVRHSRRVLAAKSGGAGYVAVGVCLAFSAGAGWLLLAQPKPAVQPAALESAKSEPVKSAPAIAAPAKTVVAPPRVPQEPEAPVDKRWTFEQGPAADLRVVKGSWLWENGKGETPGCMLVSRSQETLVELPGRAPSSPFEVAIELEVFDEQNTAYISAAWIEGGMAKLGSMWRGTISDMSLPRQRAVTTRHAFSGRYQFNYYEGKICAFRILPKERPAEQVGISVTNCRVRSIHLRTLRPEELTRELRDPAAFMERSERYVREGMSPKMAVENARE